MSDSVGQVIAISNQKGGVGKTTTAVNLAASLAVAEQKTLLIDMDPQANATQGCGFQNGNEVEGGNVYHTLIGQKEPKEVILQTKISYLSLIPSHINLTGAEVEMVNMIAREQKLDGLLNQVKKDYSYIILDCPPSLGLLTINALTAADSVLIPCLSQQLSEQSHLLEGRGDLVTNHRGNASGRSRSRANPGLS